MNVDATSETNMKLCQFCGEPVLAVAIKCKHCGSDLTQPTSQPVVQAPQANYGALLLAVPVISTLLIWFWINGMPLIGDPGSKLNFVLIATIVLTALIASMEASKLGMTSDRAKGSYSPIQWFFLLTLLWLLYPVYFLKRKAYGLPSQTGLAFTVALVFVGSWAVAASAINEHIDKVNGEIQHAQQELQQGMKEIQKVVENANQEQALNVSGSTEPPVNSQQPEVALNDKIQSPVSSEKSKSCDGLASVDDEVDCLLEKRALADKELNIQYKQLMASLDGSQKAAFKIGQRAWLKEKDQKCDETAMGYTVGMGSGWKTGPLVCETEMINQRIADFKNYK